MSLHLEPARVRAAVTAAVALCGALGIVLPFDLPNVAEALLVIASVVLPIVQGETTRAVVVPVGKLPSQATPGPDHAA